MSNFSMKITVISVRIRKNGKAIFHGQNQRIRWLNAFIFRYTFRQGISSVSKSRFRYRWQGCSAISAQCCSCSLALNFEAVLRTYLFFPDFESVRLFRCKQLRYIWDEQTQTFHKLKGLDMNVPARYLHQRKGLSCSEEYARRLVYGPNEITIPFKNIPTLLFLEVLNPYYVFQVFSVILWMCYSYYYYAVVIVIMSIFGITMSIIQTRKVRGFLCINKNFSRTSWQFPESKCPS